MAAAFSMTSLQAALPSAGVSQQVRLPTGVASSTNRLVVKAQAQRGFKLQAFSGLQRENPLHLSLGAAAPDFGITSLESNGSRWFAMRHSKRVPRLGRPADQRKALLRGLTTELLRHGRIKTTHTRARAVRKYVDKMITLAKGGSLHERRQALAFIYDKKIVKAMFEQVPSTPEYTSRNGGYTRIIRTMPRRGDNAPMSYIELVETEVGAEDGAEEDEEAEVEVVAA